MFVIEATVFPEMNNRQLILEKLVMPGRGVRVSRRRLLSLLEGSLAACTSTILSARAGAGKTTLAVDFALQSGRAVAWYKVDAPDSELPAFFEYLSASIRERRPNFSVETVSNLRAGGEDRAVEVADSFVYALEESRGDPLLIVVEDLHLVCDSKWLVPFFRRLLPLLPADVHAVITSRTLPPTPLWRMRSKQTLAVIDEEMLKFTRQEAIELFESMGLSREQACIALDHTHGRAAALASFAATLREAELGMGKEKSSAAAMITQGQGFNT